MKRLKKEEMSEESESFLLSRHGSFNLDSCTTFKLSSCHVIRLGEQGHSSILDSISKQDQRTDDINQGEETNLILGYGSCFYYELRGKDYLTGNTT